MSQAASTYIVPPARSKRRREVKRDIGVVIVNLNTGNCLRRCLNSLLKSKLPLHIVIVDTGSADNSLDGIETGYFGQCHFELRKKRSAIGFAAAVNIGLRALKCSSVMLLSPYSVVRPHTLPMLRAQLLKQQDAALIGPLLFDPNGVENRAGRANQPTWRRSLVSALGLDDRFEGLSLTTDDLPVGLVEVGAVSGAAVMLNMHKLGRIGKLDEDYRFDGAVVDLCRRAHERGYKVLFSSGVSVLQQPGAPMAGTLAAQKGRHVGMLTYYKKHSPTSDDRFFTRLSARLLHRGLLGLGLFLAGARLRARARRVRQRLNATAWPQQRRFRHRQKDLIEAGARVRNKTVLVNGAQSDVGDFLLHVLPRLGYRVIAILPDRKDGTTEVPIGNSRVRWFRTEYFSKVPAADLMTIDCWINLGPIWALKELTELIRRLQPERILALSSVDTLITTGISSRGETERAFQFLHGENYLNGLVKKLPSSGMILRTSMIYGGSDDRHIKLIETLIKYLGFLPLPGNGKILRQPVHAQDVAFACIQILQRHRLWRPLSTKAYTIAGGEQVSYRRMLRRVFRKRHQRCILIPLPVAFLGLVVKFMRKLPFPAMALLPPGMGRRMRKNLVYSNSPAKRDFGYNPTRFQP